MKGLMILSVVFLAVLSILWCVPVNAETTDTVILEWDYNTPPQDIAGFELRINKDDNNLIFIQPAARSWEGSFTFLDGNNTLDIRAKDLSGQVSGWSIPCRYDPLPGEPSGLSVKIAVDINININQ